MPSVSEILETIKGLALVGEGDSTDDARIMRYINFANREVHRRTAASYPTLLQTLETVTITNGAGTLSNIPFRVEFVKDTGNSNNPLTVTTLLDLEEENPALDATGSPSKYYFTSAKGIATYPVNSTAVKVRYVPSSVALTVTDAETAIKLPVEFHDVLVWGALFWMAYDERDKGSGQELSLAQGKYEICLGDYLTWLKDNQPVPTVRTVPVLAS